MSAEEWGDVMSLMCGVSGTEFVTGRTKLLNIRLFAFSFGHNGLKCLDVLRSPATASEQSTRNSEAVCRSGPDRP